LAEEQAAVAHILRLKTRQELTVQGAALPQGDSPERSALQRKQKILQRVEERYELTKVKRRERIAQGHVVLEKVQKEIAADAPPNRVWKR